MRLKLSIAVLHLAVIASIAFPVAAQVELNPSHPETYRVRAGDTLWDIAGYFLRDPWRWSEIWDANPDVDNPDLIFPGEVLQLYYRDGQPRVGRQRGLRTVRLSPRIRTTPLKAPVPTIPVGAIRPFLSRTYVLDQKQIDASPYVVSFPDSRVVGGVGDVAYVRSIFGDMGQAYDIVRPGEPYRDPESGRVLGYKAEFVADAVLERPGNPASLRIASMALETTAGDRVLGTTGAEPLQTFFPRPGPPGRSGRIISVLNGVSQIGQYNVVVLNLGSDQGVKPGHVFQIYNGGSQAIDQVRTDPFRSDWRNQRFWSQETWFGDFRADGWLSDEPNPNEPFPLHRSASRQAERYMLPLEPAGTLMVFRAFSGVSFALILKATRTMHVLDPVRPPRV